MKVIVNKRAGSNRRAKTHWSLSRTSGQRYPLVRVASRCQPLDALNATYVGVACARPVPARRRARGLPPTDAGRAVVGGSTGAFRPAIAASRLHLLVLQGQRRGRAASRVQRGRAE